MSKGCFIVSRNPGDQRDIYFSIKPSCAGDIPEAQLALKDDIEQSLTVLRALLPDDVRFEPYFKQLLSLAQVGLASEPAHPEVATRALVVLKNEVLTGEGGRVKNKYMKLLGLTAVSLAVPALVISLVLMYLTSEKPLANFFALWTGCMAGVWLSFGARKMTLRFEDLHMPENDQMEPIVRLVFAGLLTIIIGLAFSLGSLAVTVGTVSTRGINNNFEVALLIGMLCGFSEQTLSNKVAKQASSFLAASK